MNNISPTITITASSKQGMTAWAVFIEHIRHADMALWLVITGLNIIFFALLFGKTNFRGINAGFGIFRYTAPASLFIFLGGGIRFLTTKGRIWKRKRYRAWLGLYLAIVVIMITRSFGENKPLLDTFWGAMPYLLVAVIFVGQKKSDWWLLNCVFIEHGLIASLYGLWLLLTMHAERVGISQARQLMYGTDLVLVQALLYSVPFLFLSYPAQSRLGKVTGVTGLLIYLFIGIFGQVRSIIGAILILLTIFFYIWFLKNRRYSFTKRIAIISLIVFLMLGAIFLGLNSKWGHRSGFVLSWEGLSNRFRYNVAKDGRWEEARIVNNLMSWDKWLLGAGVAGEWSSPDIYQGEKRYMVHLGYFHLIFKGGFLLALLFLLFPIVEGWQKMLTSYNTYTIVAGGICARYSLQMLTGGAPATELWFILLFLCAGLCAGDNKHEFGIGDPHQSWRINTQINSDKSKSLSISM